MSKVILENFLNAYINEKGREQEHFRNGKWEAFSYFYHSEGRRRKKKRRGLTEPNDRDGDESPAPSARRTGNEEWRKEAMGTEWCRV